VIHVVARFDDKRTAQSDQRTKQVADDFAKALEGAADADDFQRRADAVAHEGVRTEVARYFVAANRWGVDTPMYFDADFVAAAFALQKPGAQTRFQTQFGYHVLQLIERLPPKTVPLEERRKLFADEIRTIRARRAYDALLAKLRQEHAVQISSAAEDLMNSISSSTAEP
jgi:parvulin-like peptidyl-prolyl isomerase